MRYRHRVTGLEVESDKPLGPRYERVHFEENCWCEAAALEAIAAAREAAGKPALEWSFGEEE